MGVLRKEMKKNLKVYVEGHIGLDDDTKYIKSNGIIIQEPYSFDDYVIVKLEHGPNVMDEICRVPISIVYWRKQ